LVMPTTEGYSAGSSLESLPYAPMLPGAYSFGAMQAALSRPTGSSFETLPRAPLQSGGYSLETLSLSTAQRTASRSLEALALASVQTCSPPPRATVYLDGYSLGASSSSAMQTAGSRSFEALSWETIASVQPASCSPETRARSVMQPGGYSLEAPSMPTLRPAFSRSLDALSLASVQSAVSLSGMPTGTALIESSPYFISLLQGGHSFETLPLAATQPSVSVETHLTARSSPTLVRRDVRTLAAGPPQLSPRLVDPLGPTAPPLGSVSVPCPPAGSVSVMTSPMTLIMPPATPGIGPRVPASQQLVPNGSQHPWAEDFDVLGGFDKEARQAYLRGLIGAPEFIPS
jgi:hypothetical protein